MKSPSPISHGELEQKLRRYFFEIAFCSICAETKQWIEISIEVETLMTGGNYNVHTVCMVSLIISGKSDSKLFAIPHTMTNLEHLKSR